MPRELGDALINGGVRRCCAESNREKLMTRVNRGFLESEISELDKNEILQTSSIF